MQYEGNKIVKSADYDAIMLPMACFSATDVNQDNELDCEELKTLLWLQENKEPMHHRVLKEM